MDYTAGTLCSGFAFPECPRWRDGTLWFSDQHDERVRCVDDAGTLLAQFDVPGRPSGLGWLPGGALLVVSMRERRLYRRDGDTLAVHAELAGVHPHDSNDMVVDDAGNAYVGNIGFDFHAGEAPAPTCIALARTDGTVEPAADGLLCPNGSVITPDGRTLIVAESMANRLTAFDIGTDGRLSGRRLFADLGEHVPDGICLDAGGGVWVASPYAQQVLRVEDGGAITDRVAIAGANPYACMLGGADGRTLFVCVAPDHAPEATLRLRGGRIDHARVALPGAGRP